MLQDIDKRFIAADVAWRKADVTTSVGSITPAAIRLVKVSFLASKPYCSSFSSITLAIINSGTFP